MLCNSYFRKSVVLLLTVRMSPVELFLTFRFVFLDEAVLFHDGNDCGRIRDP